MLNKILIMMISIFIAVFISYNVMMFGANLMGKHFLAGLVFVFSGFALMIGTFFSIEKIDY